jgi:dTDP-4-dehydrorhamnose reductase
MLITGASGMLGKSISKLFPKSTLLKGKKDLDLINIEETCDWFKDKHFDVIIHCAAFTDLKYCDDNPEQARILHSQIIDILCLHCDKLIYISTNPTDSYRTYYLTKQEGEKRTMLNNQSNIVLRTNIYGKGGLAEWAVSNLKDKKQIKGFSNVLFNAIHVGQLSNVIKDLLHAKTVFGGVINVAGNYTISKYDFICLVANYLDLDVGLISKSSSNLSQNLVINNSIDKLSLNEGLKLLKKDYE